MDINLNEEKDLLAVKVDGDIDVNNVGQLKKSIEDKLIGCTPNVIIDCEKLNYIDSTGLGVLVSILKKVQVYDGVIKIINLKPYLNKIFEVTGLTKIFDIEVAMDE